MINDTHPFIRSDGYTRILAARRAANGCVREMFDWDIFEPTEPPCLQFFAKDHLEALQYSIEIIELPAYPRHFQNTERFVHTVHESAMAVTDEQRMGHILSNLESRQKYSKLESR